MEILTMVMGILLVMTIIRQGLTIRNLRKKNNKLRIENKEQRIKYRELELESSDAKSELERKESRANYIENQVRDYLKELDGYRGDQVKRSA